MKTTSHKLMAICLTLILTSFACPLAITAQTTVTFDDLDVSTLPGEIVGGESAPIPDGYNGLQWNRIRVADVPVIAANGNPNSGYQNGLVSGNNVAFGLYGAPDSIIDSSGSFNFNSVYLTAAWNNGLKLQVEGFVGGVLTYNNNYTLNATGPSFITFNYLNVNEVTFISSGGTNAGYGGFGTEFAMDNMTISAVPEPTSLAYAGFGGFASLFAFCRRKNSASV